MLLERDHLLDADYLCASGTSRTRGFAFLVYEDSAPENWIETLDSLHIMAFVSPRHDNDYIELFNTETKQFIITTEKKKPHYHVMLMFEGVKSDKQVEDIANMVGAANGHFIKLNSIVGYARYLVHMDQPSKYHYDAFQVRCLGGADYFAVINIPRDKYSTSIDIIRYIKEVHIYVYSDLCELFAETNYLWYINLHDSPTFWFQYLKSASWKQQAKLIKKKEDKLLSKEDDEHLYLDEN